MHTNTTTRTPAQQAEFPPAPFPPFPPAPQPGRQPPEVHVRAPLVYVTPAWEYHVLTRPLAESGSEATAEALRALGAEGWELTGVVGDGQAAHFYLKRERMAGEAR